MYRTLPYLALFAATVLLQVFLFDNLSISVYLNPLVYIAFIVLLPLDTLPTRTIEKEAGRFWIKNGVGEYTFVADSTTCGHLAIALPYMVFGDSRFLVLGDDRWKGTTSPRRMSIDYAIVVPGFRGKIDPVRQIFDIRQVILAHNLPYFQRKSLEEECRRLRIACHSIHSDGAFVAPVSPAVRNRKRVSD